MLLRLDFSSDIPIYQQIRNQIVLAIASGELSRGDKLPTIRSLADESGVNMMTVNKAYQLLKQEGYIMADRRSGAVVTGGGERGGLSEELRERLRLIVSEAKLGGMPKEELLRLTERLYEEGEA